MRRTVVTPTPSWRATCCRVRPTADGRPGADAPVFAMVAGDTRSHGGRVQEDPADGKRTPAPDSESPDSGGGSPPERAWAHQARAPRGGAEKTPRRGAPRKGPSR